MNYLNENFSRKDFTGKNFQEYEYQNCDLRNTIFKSCQLNGIQFLKGDLRGINFSKSSIINGYFYNVDLRGCDFSESNLQGANFIECNLSGVDFSNLVLNYLKFDSCIVDGANFKNTYFSRTEFFRINFQYVNLYGCRFDDTSFQGCDFSNCGGTFQFDIKTNKKIKEKTTILQEKKLASLKINEINSILSRNPYFSLSLDLSHCKVTIYIPWKDESNSNKLNRCFALTSDGKREYTNMTPKQFHDSILKIEIKPKIILEKLQNYYAKIEWEKDSKLCLAFNLLISFIKNEITKDSKKIN